jgi:glycogen operon protein
LRGERIADDTFYLLFNAHHEPLTFVLPNTEWGQQWICVLDTQVATVPDAPDEPLAAEQETHVPDRSIRVLQRVSA